MATELTAEAVWEMVKDLPGLDEDFRSTLRSTDLNAISTLCAWSCNQKPSWPTQALALIVDAMKREMGEVWRGCTVVETATLTNWYAVVIVSGVKRVLDAPTEAEAVIAAYRAWKEGK